MSASTSYTTTQKYNYTEEDNHHRNHAHHTPTSQTADTS